MTSYLPTSFVLADQIAFADRVGVDVRRDTRAVAWARVLDAVEVGFHGGELPPATDEQIALLRRLRIDGTGTTARVAEAMITDRVAHAVAITFRDKGLGDNITADDMHVVLRQIGATIPPAAAGADVDLTDGATLTLADVARVLGVHANTLRHHLDGLPDEARPVCVGRGRVRRRWRPSQLPAVVAAFAEPRKQPKLPEWREPPQRQPRPPRHPKPKVWPPGTRLIDRVRGILPKRKGAPQGKADVKGNLPKDNK